MTKVDRQEVDHSTYTTVLVILSGAKLIFSGIKGSTTQHEANELKSEAFTTFASNDNP